MTTSAGVQFKHPPLYTDVSVEMAATKVQTLLEAASLDRFALTLIVADSEGNTLTLTRQEGEDKYDAVNRIVGELWDAADEMGWTEMGTRVTVVSPGGSWQPGEYERWEASDSNHANKR